MSRPGVLVKHLAMRGPHLSARRGALRSSDSTQGAPSRGDPPRDGATDLTGAVPVMSPPRPQPLAEPVPTMSRCELDPEMYRVFAFAVLAWHRRLPKQGGDRCACGQPWLSCEYVDLADKLLWTGAGSWRPA
jgi:hypothetical protein